MFAKGGNVRELIMRPSRIQTARLELEKQLAQVAIERGPQDTDGVNSESQVDRVILPTGGSPPMATAAVSFDAGII